MALRGHGGSLYLEFSAHVPSVTPFGVPRPQPEHLFRRIRPETVRREVEEAGGRVEHEEIVAGHDVTDSADPAVCRMRITFPAPGSAPAAPAAQPERTE